MARWRLKSSHYLNTDPPAEIEFKETDRTTGRQARKVYKIPRLLDTKDPADHNYDGEIIVSDGHNPQPRDYIFLGEPTSEMDPVDDEAHKITDHLISIGRFKRPEEGLNSSDTLIKILTDKMDQMQLSIQPVASSVDPKAFTDLQAQVKALMEQNIKLQTENLARKGA